MFFSTQETFDTEKLVHTDCTRKFYEVFTDRLSAGRNFTQSSFYTAETFSHRSLYAQKKYAQQVFTDRRILHRKFSAQKSYAQKVLRTTFFTYRRFYTQMSLHRHKLHTETCAHSTRLHTTNFYAERLCFLFLITYLSCSPLSSHLGR